MLVGVLQSRPTRRSGMTTAFLLRACIDCRTVCANMPAMAKLYHGLDIAPASLTTFKSRALQPYIGLLTDLLKHFGNNARAAQPAR